MDLSILEGLASEDQGATNLPSMSSIAVANHVQSVKGLLAMVTQAVEFDDGCVGLNLDEDDVSDVTEKIEKAIASNTSVTVFDSSDYMENAARDPSFSFDKVEFFYSPDSDGDGDVLDVFGVVGHFTIHISMYIPSYCDDECDAGVNYIVVKFHPSNDMVNECFSSMVNTHIGSEVHDLLSSAKRLLERSLGKEAELVQADDLIEQMKAITENIKL